MYNYLARQLTYAYPSSEFVPWPIDVWVQDSLNLSSSIDHNSILLFTMQQNN